MIKKIRPHNLHNAELLQFFNDVITICNLNSTEPMKLASVIATLLTDTTTFKKLFKLDKGSATTKELVKLDARRDRSVVGIHLLLESYTNHFEPDIIDAARILLANMDKYGPRIAKLNYPSETITINHMLKEWHSNTKLTSAVNLLNLNSWLDEMKIANDLFNELYLQRSNDEASKPHIKTFDARQKALKSYRKLIARIDAGNTLDEEGIYSTLINSLNNLIEKYNLISDSHINDKEEE